MKTVQLASGASRMGRGVGALLTTLFAAVGILLMHGVADRWIPTLARSGPASATIADPSGNPHDVVGHHDVEKCVPCGVLGALTIGLLATAFRAPSREGLGAFVSGWIVGLDLSPPRPPKLCVALC